MLEYGFVMKKYDLILPLGSACKTTHNLRKRNLQRESLPFDWILLLDTQVIIQLLRSHFQGFLLRENMKKKELENTLHDVYVDVSSKIEFWHDFPLNCNFDEMFDEVKRKYKRRIDRMYDDIRHARNILLFRTVIVAEGTLTDEQLLKDYQDFCEIFPNKNVDYIYVNLFHEPCEYQETYFNPHLLKINAFTPKEDEWMGNQELFDKILGNVALSSRAKMKYFFKTKKFQIYKSLIKAGALLKIPSCVKKKQVVKDRFRAE